MFSFHLYVIVTDWILTAVNICFWKPPLKCPIKVNSMKHKPWWAISHELFIVRCSCFFDVILSSSHHGNCGRLLYLSKCEGLFRSIICERPPWECLSFNDINSHSKTRNAIVYIVVSLSVQIVWHHLIASWC